MSDKIDEYWKKCIEHWLSVPDKFHLNTVCSAAKEAENKGDYETAIYTYEIARMHAYEEFQKENENQDKENALWELAQVYESLAYEIRQKLLTIVQDSKKRIIAKMEQECPKTEEDISDLEKITDDNVREVMSNLMTIRNHATKTPAGKKDIKNYLNANHEEWKKKYEKTKGDLK